MSTFAFFLPASLTTSIQGGMEKQYSFYENKEIKFKFSTDAFPVGCVVTLHHNVESRHTLAIITVKQVVGGGLRRQRQGVTQLCTITNQTTSMEADQRPNQNSTKCEGRE